MAKNRRIISIELIFVVVIITVIVGIITLIGIQIRKEANQVLKTAEATRIASNILENINSRTYESVNEYITEFSGVGVVKKMDESVQNIQINGNSFNDTFFGVQIPTGFSVEFNSENSSSNFDVIKNITLNINYEISGKEECFKISTVLEKENIEECNKPIISDSYFQNLGFNSYDYEFIPIKYSNTVKSFIVANQGDLDWYNYSAKKWAKVLIFSRDADNLKDLFVQEDGTIKNQVNYDNNLLDIQNYIYVWIPNFSIKDDISYFRYGTSKRAIKMDFQYLNNNYLYLNRVSEIVADISKECSFDGIAGVWRKLDDTEDVYYKNFNLSKYAPIDLY